MDLEQSDKEILDQFFTDVRQQIIVNSDQQNRNATGNAKEKLRIETAETSGKLIDGAGYVQWGWEYGRGPGGLPPIEKIKAWIEVKGIIPDHGTVENFAWAIAKKQAKEGSKLFRQHEPSGVITDVVTQDRIDALKESFSERYRNLIKTELIRAFKQ